MLMLFLIRIKLNSYNFFASFSILHIQGVDYRFMITRISKKSDAVNLLEKADLSKGWRSDERTKKSKHSLPHI